VLSLVLRSTPICLLVCSTVLRTSSQVRSFRFDFACVPKHFAVAVLRHRCFFKVALAVWVRLREIPVAGVCFVAVNAFAHCYIRHISDFSDY
jgi:hypothetical protein